MRRNDGWTALHLVAAWFRSKEIDWKKQYRKYVVLDHVEAAKVLLQHGADINAKTVE